MHAACKNISSIAAMTVRKARALPCDTSAAAPLPTGGGAAPLAALALEWQRGELNRFLDHVSERLVRGGLPC